MGREDGIAGKTVEHHVSGLTPVATATRGLNHPQGDSAQGYGSGKLEGQASPGSLWFGIATESAQFRTLLVCICGRRLSLVCGMRHFLAKSLPELASRKF
jgi:hypothetical protein